MQMKGIFLKLIPLALAALLSACSDENAFAVGEEQLDDSKAEAYLDAKYSSSAAAEDDCYYENFELHTASWCCSKYGYGCETACYLGTASYSDSWCCNNYGYQCAVSSSSSACNSWYGCSSSSSSYSYTYSSSSAAKSYLETSKTMKLTLTYYKQLAYMDEASLSDGDPKISFKVKFFKMTGDSTISNTGTMLSLSNQGSWSGTKTTSLTVPAYTESIYVCPSVIDEDVLFDDDYSSNYCYIVHNVGYLSNYVEREQDDYMSTKYALEWNWYLY